MIDLKARIKKGQQPKVSAEAVVKESQEEDDEESDSEASVLYTKKFNIREYVRSLL